MQLCEKLTLDIVYIIKLIYIAVMKKLILFLFISVGLNAQFNYQAIVKDSDGNPVTNNQVKFKFSLMYQSSTATPIFVEEHNITTPADGVVNLSVGGGSVVNGTFSHIDWSQSVFMKEELDTGSGYQDMGTRQIASVPVAEYAKISTISSATFIDSNLNVGIGTDIETDVARSNIGIGAGVLQSLSNSSGYTSYDNIGIGTNSLGSLTAGDVNIAIGDRTLTSLESGYLNLAIGNHALSSLVSGTDNLAIGADALLDNQASRNLAIGALSLQGNIDGTVNTAVGFMSMEDNIDGFGNTALGDASLSENVSGNYNVAIGRSSLQNNVTGSNNTVVGDASGFNNISGINNTAIGEMSLFNNKTGNYNVAVGAYTLNTLDDEESGYGNVGIGAASLEYLKSGSLNIGIGHGAGPNTESSTINHSTFIGAYSAAEVDGLDNSIAIGFYATVSSSNTMQLGNQSLELVNTSGIVSATGFKGNGDEITLTDSGTIVTLLDKIAQLENKIEQLEANQSVTSNTSTSSISSAYAFFEKHGGKIWAYSENVPNTANIYFQFSTINEIESENKVGTQLYYEEATGIDDCSEYFLGDNPDDSCSGTIIQLVSNSPDEVIFKTIDYDECENGSDGSLSEVTFTIVGDKMYMSEIGDSTFEYYNLVSSVQGTNCYD